MEKCQKSFPNRIKRQKKGGGIMIWGAITSENNFKVIRLTGRVNGAKYLTLIKDDVQPWMDSIFHDQKYLTSEASTQQARKNSSCTVFSSALR